MASPIGLPCSKRLHSAAKLASTALVVRAGIAVSSPPLSTHTSTFDAAAGIRRDASTCFAMARADELVSITRTNSSLILPLNERRPAIKASSTALLFCSLTMRLIRAFSAMSPPIFDAAAIAVVAISSLALATKGAIAAACFSAWLAPSQLKISIFASSLAFGNVAATVA